MSDSAGTPGNGPDATPAWKRLVLPPLQPRGASVLPPIGNFGHPRALATGPKVPMGLQFELREQTPRTNDRWRGPTAKPVKTLVAGHGEFRLGVRPVIQNANGNWVRSNVTWSHLTFQLNRFNLDPEHHRWISQFSALYKAVREVYTSQETDWIYLDNFTSPLLWPLLREAEQLGIGFVGNKKDVVVRVGSLAHVSLDASQADAAGPLLLQARLHIDGTTYPLEAAGIIAGHGVYSVRLGAPTVFTLAPTNGPLSPEQRHLVGQVDPAAVPAADTAEFLGTVYPALQRRVAVTSTDASVRFPEVLPDNFERIEPPRLVITTIETDQRDWFDLGVIVTIGEITVPFGPLFTALATGQTRLKLVDNSYLSLQQPEFERLHELIDEARALQEWETGLRISRYQASLWSDFEDLADETVSAVSWRAAAAGLKDPSGVDPIVLPDTVHATLRPYQQEGFAWLAFLWQHQLGGVLADDMGLGKTLQTLALLVHATESKPGPFLVVAPTSVVANWLNEATRFTPGLRVRTLMATESKSRTRIADTATDADVLITSYALFRLEFEAYQAVTWAGLILDEAQFVKNRTSRAYACAKELDTPFKLAITGTPLENNLMDLWSLFSIVAPGLFASARKFTEDYVRPVTRGEGPQRLAKLRRRIRPLLLRRTKEVVARDLPPKQEQELQIALNPAHQKLYDTFLQRERQKLYGLIEELDKNRFIIFRSLTLLRLLSLDASLVDQKFAGVRSSKLDALFEQLDDVIAEGHKALIFSQFTSFLKRAAARLDAQGVPYCYLDGSTLRRSEVIDRFKSGAAPVFLISLKAGGFGLNLTEADYVFLLDPWWNPATEAQAVDRTHRIGQTRNVMVYRMVATGTIEEKVVALQKQKAQLFTAVLDDDAMFSTALTAEDIRGLLEP
ncbi:superfamily II DNA or RNA helicase [Cryobacterium sp. CAN_C3]|uniref:DEAD/DEAH box helicase n=1 Tax=unclassified Cryobacterium TaxID=2649013 RepID=UPI0018CBA80F|nr:DEAD/DEAH box helicase [Cryobacterium sp. CAN_C3]MEC5153678.1 superfamily II DNA or RNA helicase [Cryobacterium sp. CAN_C3]